MKVTVESARNGWIVHIEDGKELYRYVYESLDNAFMCMLPRLELCDDAPRFGPLAGSLHLASNLFKPALEAPAKEVQS